MTLRARLTLFYAAFFAIVVGLVASGVYLLTERSLMSALEERASQALGDLSEGAILEGLRKLPGDAYYEVRILGAGEILPTSAAEVRAGVPYIEPALFRPNPSDDSLVNLMPDAALEVLVDTGDVTATVELPSGERLQVLGTVGRLTFTRQGVALTAAVFVGVRAGNVTATLQALTRNLALILAFAIATFTFGVFALSGRALRPLEFVTDAAARVTSRDLSQRVPVPASDDEIHALAVTVNGMLDRLQESFEMQRRFTADASHELRTPVTAIAGHANYLLRRTHPTPAQLESLEVIRSEANRLAKLVNDLLELARADAGLSIEKHPMNLVEVAEAVKDAFAASAAAVTVEVRAPSPIVEVVGDAARLQQVFTNLVQNAVNAGAHTVTMTFAQQADAVQVDVLDDGPGIPEAAVPHLFERFYRVDGARSGRGNGSGLGLAIVKWIVQQHGGTVEVHARLGEGSVFALTLPVHARPEGVGEEQDVA